LGQPPVHHRNHPRSPEDAGFALRGNEGAPGHDREHDARARTAVSRARHQNPIEYEGTYPLPEAQLDRFLVRISIGYPAREDEIEMLERRLERGVDEVELEPVVDAPTLVELQRALEQVHVSEAIEGYVVDLVTATRDSQRLAVGASPRGSIALLKLSRAKAALSGRDFVTPEDVKAVAVPALAHRLMVRPELWVQRLRGEDVVREALETVPTPPAEDSLRTAEA